MNSKCINCRRNERLTSFSKDSIAYGDHIYMGGDFKLFNLGKKQQAFYKHHAMVKKVQPVSKSAAVLTLIHFTTTPFDTRLKIRETQELKDLHYDEIYVVKYRHRSNTMNERMLNAYQYLNENLIYSFSSYNCEHFCNACCMTISRSRQVNHVKQVIPHAVALTVNAACYLFDRKKLQCFQHAALILHSYLQMDDDTPCVTRVQNNENLTYRYFYAGVLANRYMPDSVIYRAVIGLIGIALVSAVNAALIAKKIRNKMYLQSNAPSIKVDTVKDIKAGDVISTCNLGVFTHDCIVCKEPEEHNNEQRVELSIIHYTRPQYIFGRREIKKETIVVDLSKDVIEKRYCSKNEKFPKYKVYTPERVLERANSRIGETRLSLLSNSSRNFCYWSKVDEDVVDPKNVRSQPLQFLDHCPPEDDIRYPEINVNHHIDRKMSSMKLRSYRAYISEEIKRGQIIEFRYGGPPALPHKVICTEVEKEEANKSKFTATVVHYGRENVVAEERFTFDLRYDEIKIHAYHPMFCHDTDTAIARARQKIGNCNYNYFTRSSHLITDIFEKSRYERVRDIKEIKMGDAITFYYNSSMHDVIVSAVSINNNKAHVTIVHYAAPDAFFGQRKIKKETLCIQLPQDVVYFIGFPGFVTYPEDEAIERAESRIGEQRFSTDENTSSDFVHWAKVVQTPVLVNFKNHNNLYKKLLVPRIGEQFGEFQRVKVYTWSDLTVGSIVEYQTFWMRNVGILVGIENVDNGRKRITVLHYTKGSFVNERNVAPYKTIINLKDDCIWIYRCHPALRRAPEEIAERSVERCGFFWNGSFWGFCKWCVFKKEVLCDHRINTHES